MKKFLYEISIKFYLWIKNRAMMKSRMVGNIYLGTGIGIVSNSMFVVFMEEKQILTGKIILSLLYAIILIALGSEIIEKE